MAPSGHTRLGTLLDVLRRPESAWGCWRSFSYSPATSLSSLTCVPFLETVTGVGVNALSAILLGFGVANFIGTSAAGFMLERNLRLTLALIPLLMGTSGLALAATGSAPSRIRQWWPCGLCIRHGAGGMVNMDHPQCAGRSRKRGRG